MPKIVDHDARRRELVSAALRVITTEGFAAASVRRVAQEAGHSPGALRHYFPRQDALVAEVLDEVTRTAAARLIPRILDLGVAGPDAVVGAACALLEELMPLDEQRMTEWAVWSAIVDPPSVPATLEQWRRAGWAGSRHHCRSVVSRLSAPTPRERPKGDVEVPGADDVLASTLELSPLPDPVAEARAAGLHAVVDGLSVQLVTHPADVTPVAAQTALHRVVSDLALSLLPRVGGG